jgi:hypothetical protein
MCCAWRVSWPIDSLPDDIDALRALALNAIAERDAAITERDRLIELNDRLRRLLRKVQGFVARNVAKIGFPEAAFTDLLAADAAPGLPTVTMEREPDGVGIVRGRRHANASCCSSRFTRGKRLVIAACWCRLRTRSTSAA